MALFKILKGNLAGLPVKATEGYMYITEDTRDIFVDVATADTATVGENRIQLNADQANSLRKKIENEDGTVSIQTIDYDDINTLINDITELNSIVTGINQSFAGLNQTVANNQSAIAGQQESLRSIDSQIEQIDENIDTINQKIETEHTALNAKIEEQGNEIKLNYAQLKAENLFTEINTFEKKIIVNEIIEILQNPTESNHATNKQYVDNKTATNKQHIDNQVSQIENSITALNQKDNELNNKFNNYLPIIGGKLMGSLIMDGGQTITIPNQPGENDNTLAVNKLYVDTSIENAKNTLTAAYQKDDEAINNTITGLNTKIGNNTTAISELTTKHNDDISNLTSKIDTEITNRSNADEAFQEAINVIEKDIADLVDADRGLDAAHKAIKVTLTGDATSSETQIDSNNKISIATTLKNSGVTAGSYGLSANAVPNYEESFNIPYITVDAKGRVTAASNKTVTLPAAIDLSGIEASISGLEAVNNTQNTNITNLTTRMGTAETNISNNTSAIEDEVEAREAAISSEASARAAAVKTVADNLTGLSTKHNAINVVLTSDVTGTGTINSEDKISITTTLKNSGVAAGSYGPSADATPASGAQFDVPSIEVDAKGRIVKASTKKVTMPSVKTIEDNIASLDARINPLEAGKLSNTNPEVTTQTIEPSTNKKLTLNAVSEVTASGWTVADTKTNYELDLSSFATNEELTAEITSLSNAMVFRGTLGLGGTITDLPAAAASTWGDTYKVITAGTYAGKEAKIGDIFTCAKPVNEDYSWKLIPSGDEPSGTVINVNTDYGITTADGNPITSSGTIIADLTSYTKLGNAAADGTETANRVYPVRLDKNGKLAVNVPWFDTDTDHIYKAGTGLTLVNNDTFSHTNNIEAGTAQGDSNITLTFGGNLNIPSINYDTEGHITSVGTTTVAMPSIQNIEDALDDLRDADTGFNEKFNDYLPLTGGTLTNDLYIQLNGTSYKVYHEGYAPAGITIREW